MSHEEKANFVEKIRNALLSYKGFTQKEKHYADVNLNRWIGAQGELDLFIKKFSEISLDVRPFLFEKQLMHP